MEAGERTSNIIDHDCDGGIADVRRDQRAEAFLAGSIP